MTFSDNINQLTRQYNDAIRALENSYDMERSQQGLSGLSLSSLRSKSKLKRAYSQRYEALEREYRQKCNEMAAAYKKSHPQWAKWRNLWIWIFFGGFMAALVCCGAALPYEDAPASTLSSTVENTPYWNAENIPIPYLQDDTQYVSNPDSVLSQGAVDRMNVTLQHLEKELNIQPVVIVVNHIENDDPFRMAQDVGNRYGVGFMDRGLVVVVGYLDHSINMSPGRSLEGDLTDAECYRLEQQYVVPAMRAEMPDSGMIYLAEAVYSTLQQKELPQMSQLSSGSQSDDDFDAAVAIPLMVTLLFLTGWGLFFLRMNTKYQWFRLLGGVALLPNPFYTSEGFYVSSGGGFGKGGGFSGGGGFHGGSFGGGSFGGGGATSRW